VGRRSTATLPPDASNPAEEIGVQSHVFLLVRRADGDTVVSSGPMSSLLYDLALSPFYDRLVQLWPLWVHPNAITCLGGAGAAASLLAMRRGSWVAACAAFTAYHMLDNMDGKQARRTGKSSRLGHVLDHALDGASVPDADKSRAWTRQNHHTKLSLSLFATLQRGAPAAACRRLARRARFVPDLLRPPLWLPSGAAVCALLRHVNPPHLPRGRAMLRPTHPRHRLARERARRGGGSKLQQPTVTFLCRPLTPPAPARHASLWGRRALPSLLPVARPPRRHRRAPPPA